MSTSENEHVPGASKEIEEEGNELVKGPPVDTREAPPDTPGTHEIGTHYQPVSTTEEDLLGIESPSNDDGAEDDIAQLPNPGEGHSAISEATHPAVGLGDSNIQKLKELDIPLQKTEASGKSRSREKSLPPPPLPLKDHAYQDSTPKTPLISRSPTRTQSDHDSYNEKIGLDEPDAPPDYEENEKQSQTQKQEQEPSSINAEDSESEIQSIIGQFQDEEGAANEEDVRSPRLDLAGQLLGGAMQYPPRRSSLEPLRSPVADREDPPTSPWVSSPPLQSPGQRMQRKFSSQSLTPHSPSHFAGPTPTGMAEGPSSPASLPHPPPPEPEPDQPFDFHRFLEQLRHRTADPVAKFLRSFLTEFGKKQWMVHEQVKIISDFLAFITNKMAQCEIWRGVSDAEFDNAKEGMEKLVMNRLYTQTFSPAIPPPPPPPRPKGKRKEIERMTTPGRRGQHQEDVERDEILAQKVRIYGWVTEEHLEIPEVGPNGRRFLTLAQQGNAQTSPQTYRDLT
jgi:Rab5 GDP/GTP exchange factor